MNQATTPKASPFVPQSGLHIAGLTLLLPDGTVLCQELSFGIRPGEICVLMGPSGSGKSSVLGWMTGTLAPQLQATGELWLNGRNLTEQPTERRRLGLMLQQDYLFPHMSVGENLAFGLRRGPGSVTRAERRERVEQVLAAAGLVGMAARDPATLSGGQRARVSLIRTLLSEPCALLLDEPFSRLDATLREQIRTFTWQTAAELPVLLVTHDLEDCPAGARVLSMPVGDGHAPLLQPLPT